MAITKINTPELFDLGTTNSSLRLPSGDTASRPSNPNTGEWRYNTDDNYVEYWDGSAWFQIDYESTVVPCTTNTINYPTAVTAYYKMEDATDQTGNYNGTATNVNFNVAGKFGNAGEFNGSSSYINLNSAVLPSSVFSVSFWVNVNSLVNEWIFTQYTPSVTGRFVFNITSTGGFQINVSSVNSLASTNIPAITIGNWHHVVVVKDGSNGWTLYADGQPHSTWTNTESIITNQNTILGGDDSVTSNNLDGKLDQVRIFPSALTSGQVTQLYNEVQCAPTIVPSEHFNVNTYVGNGSTQIIDAKFNEAAVFNGSSSKIQGTPQVAQQGFSWSAWINYTDTNIYKSIITYSNNNQIGGFGDSIFINTQPNGAVSAGMVYSGSFRFNFTHPTTGLNNGAWHHVAFTWDGTTNANAVKLYVNGTVATSTSTATAASMPNFADFYLGYFNDIAPNRFAGKIDQVRIYDTALTQQQVTELYTNETTATAQLLDFPVGAGCIAAYELDGDASDVGKTYGGIPTNIGYTGMQFQPDWVWIKPRSYADNHNLFDSIRGATKQLVSNSTSAESTQPNTLQSFNSNGFTTGPDNNTNISGSTYVAWNWKAGGPAVSGSGTNVSLVTQSENAAAGFGIYRFKTTSSNNTNITINHNLNAPPEMVIIKETSGTGHWYVYHSTLGTNKYIIMSLASAATTASSAWGAGMTSSVIGARTAQTVDSNQTHVAYAFHSVDGFSKIGSYIGTGASGNSIVTGFEPAFVMIKNATDTGGANWVIIDNKRDDADAWLYPNVSDAEFDDGNTYTQFNSNGFTVNLSASYVNTSGATYIFMAFAADPAPEPVLANSFDISLYTGNGTTQNIYSSLSPDLVWIKSRSTATSHELNDSVRGQVSRLFTDSTSAQSTIANGFVSLDSNGFSLNGTGGGGEVNTNGRTYVAWQWKAAEIPAINNNGSITSIVSANPAAGFSIVSWTSTATTSTIGHGLENPPSIVIMKSKSNSGDWQVYSSAIGATQKLLLNGTNAASSSGVWGNTSPNENVFTSAFNNSGNIIAYCFHSVNEYQKVGSYQGGGASNVTVNLGFSPRFVMIKRATGGNGNWIMYDNVRQPGTVPYNNYTILLADDAYQEQADNTIRGIQFTSTGIVLNQNYSLTNTSGSTYIYLAIA